MRVCAECVCGGCIYGCVWGEGGCTECRPGYSWQAGRLWGHQREGLGSGSGEKMNKEEARRVGCTTKKE